MEVKKYFYDIEKLKVSKDYRIKVFFCEFQDSFVITEMDYQGVGETENTQFFFDYEENGRMISVTTLRSDLFYVKKIDWFDSYDGNVYYSIIERNLQESPNCSILLKNANRAGMPCSIYEKYEWQDLHHLHPVSREEYESTFYQRNLQAWQNHRYVLKEAKDGTALLNTIFPYSFDEELQDHAVYFAKTFLKFDSSKKLSFILDKK